MVAVAIAFSISLERMHAFQVGSMVVCYLLHALKSIFLFRRFQCTTNNYVFSPLHCIMQGNCIFPTLALNSPCLLVRVEQHEEKSIGFIDIILSTFLLQLSFSHPLALGAFLHLPEPFSLGRPRSPSGKVVSRELCSAAHNVLVAAMLFHSKYSRRCCALLCFHPTRRVTEREGWVTILWSAGLHC